MENVEHLCKEKVILQGVVGSHAYGLNHSGSDIDQRGCFVYPTEQILKLGNPQETIDRVDPDVCWHEVKKFLTLASNGNPNILEIFWLPEYEVLTPEGELLVGLREVLLSQKVKATYGGYAISQIRRLERRGDGSFKSKLRKRKEKHARHCFRLLRQGRQILEEGRLDVKVSNPEELFEIGRLPDEELIRRFDKEHEAFEAVESTLPLVPDMDAVNDVLISIRKSN